MKIIELTPEHMRCGVGMCPGVFKTAQGKIVIIGRLLDQNEMCELGLDKKVGKNEMAVEIDAEYLPGVNL